MKFVKIKKIRKVDPEDVYHLTVEKNSNFFANKLCVHNCDYRGEICIIIDNISNGDTRIPYHIKKGDRIAQGVICPIIRATFETVENLSDSERGSGGFGSTDK